MQLGRRNAQRGNRSGIMTASDVMQVAAGAPTPWNAGDNSEIRTQQIRTKHSNFEQKEVDSLRVQAAKRQGEASRNRQAYQALRKIEAADATDQTAFRGYQVAVSRATVAKKRADVGKATALTGQAPVYARMGYSLGAAAHEASVKVQEYQAVYADVRARWQ